MKKILAVILAVIMAFSIVVSAVAADNTTSAETTDASCEQTEGIFDSLASAIKDLIHKIVHLLANIFGVDCPFDDSDDAVTPEEPTTAPETTTEEPTTSETTTEPEVNYVTISADELRAKLSGTIGTDLSVSVSLDANYKVVGDWTPLSYDVSVYDVRLKNLTIDGNGYTISGLTAPLVKGSVSQNVTIKNLTITDSAIYCPEVENGLGVGAFIANADSTVLSLTINNCNLTNSSVKATDECSAGAFVGYVGQNDVSITNCTVDNCKINGKNAGGIVGFCMTQAEKTQTIENCEVTETEITGKYVGSIAANVSNNGELTIKNCKFSGDAVDANRKFATVTIIG